MAKTNITGPVDCACVIHGAGYSWEYVDRLYSMLSRHITPGIRLHVYTEEHREVPAPYIKHVLEDWGFGGLKKSWWYKMQLFNSEHHSGPLLYFDLDTVIVNNIDWICQAPLNYFWTIRDFKHLWKPTNHGANSSVMWWNTETFDYVWRNFKSQDLTRNLAKYRGDQDYITDAITTEKLRFFDTNCIKSWRWECLDGGYVFDKKRYLKPGTGTVIPDRASVLIFHGNPKPSQITDPVIIQHWQ